MKIERIGYFLIGYGIAEAINPLSSHNGVVIAFCFSVASLFIIAGVIRDNATERQIFLIDWCSQCGVYTAICPVCDMNDCSGGYGDILGTECPACPVVHDSWIEFRKTNVFRYFYSPREYVAYYMRRVSLFLRNMIWVIKHPHRYVQMLSDSKRQEREV